MRQEVGSRGVGALVEGNLERAGVHKLQDVRIRAKGAIRLEEVPKRQILRRGVDHSVLVQDGDLPERHLRDLQPQPGQPRRDRQANSLLIC